MDFVFPVPHALHAADNEAALVLVQFRALRLSDDVIQKLLKHIARFTYAVRNLYFFTLYRGTNGMMIGTVRTYF